MKMNSFFGVLLMGVLLTGCSKDNLTEELSPGLDAAAKKGPAVQQMNSGYFAGRLFDLATAPNGDLLVADVSAGIFDFYGNLEAELPGVSSLDPVGRGNLWAATGAAGGGEGRASLYRINRDQVTKIADLHKFEEENDPDGAGVDSNPFSVAALNGSTALVADAAANDLLRVDNQGNIEVVAIFPNELVSTENIKNLLGCPGSGAELCSLPAMMPAQAVPTSVVIGPDGYYYVGELKGFPAPTGASKIWKISPGAVEAMCGESEDCVKAFEGFTSIIDMTFDKHGMLYVAELDAQSWFAVEVLHAGVGGVIKVCDPETMQCNVIASGIPMLTAITFDKDGKLWATRNALAPGMAQVVQIPL